MLELNAQTIAFFIFAILSLGGALGVVTSRNLIHGALYLIVSLFGGAGFFVLLSAPFHRGRAGARLHRRDRHSDHLRGDAHAQHDDHARTVQSAVVDERCWSALFCLSCSASP